MFEFEVINCPTEHIYNPDKHLARQMYPDKMQYLLECFKDSMDKPYGYTVLDLNQTTPGYLRVQTGICPGEERIIYQEK